VYGKTAAATVFFTWHQSTEGNLYLTSHNDLL